MFDVGDEAVEELLVDGVEAVVVVALVVVPEDVVVDPAEVDELLLAV